MDIQKLQCVVSLRRLKNVTKAAEENHLTQPSMTAKINAIEEEVGAKLFLRSNRAVQVTPAGAYFADKAEYILEQYQKMLLKTRQIAHSGERALLTLGINQVSTSPFLGEIADAFSHRFPNTRLHFFKSSLSELSENLEKGKVDLIITNQFETSAHPLFKTRMLMETTPCVYLHEAHRLAQKDILTLDDLQGEYLLCAGSEDGLSLSKAAQCLAEGGIPFEADSIIHNEETILSMVSAGIGLYPAAAWYRHSCPANVRCVPLKIQVVNMVIVLAWIKDELDEQAKAMADIARNLFQQAEKNGEGV